MRLSQRLQDERAYVLTNCTGVICSRCGATFANYLQECSAKIFETCPGFDTIQAVKQKFHETYQG